MSIVSYAQNFEDVMLWRALKDVENGFYIDIGANHPVIDSVTKSFYENGWSGVNVEPEYELYELLKADRPRDLNLNIAISSCVDSIEFYVSSIRGWSTTNKESSTNLKDKDSFSEVRIVQAISLDKLCENNNINVVHFLKIDVEGAEKDVLESFSFQKVRPWIVVVEATKPTTQIDVSIEWEDILYNHDYIFAYFDGLNKYYISSEHKELLKFFSIPPNVFDKFILASHRDAIAKVDETETKINTILMRMTELETIAQENEVRANKAEVEKNKANLRVQEAEARADEALTLYNIVVNSNSWKLTKPLRLAGKGARWFINGSKAWLTFSPTSRPRRVYNYLFFKEIKEMNTVNNHELIYGCNRDKDKPFVVADMYVLGQNVKTGVYRVCDEIYKRLNQSDQINFNYYVKESFIENSEHYLKENKFKCSEQKTLLKDKLYDIDFFIAPFGIAPYDIVNKKNIKYIHFIYDLIAIKHPEYFTDEGAKEVKAIMNSLDSETIIFAISEYTKNELLNYKKDLIDEQITVIPLAADEKFMPHLDKELKKIVCQKYSIPYNKPYILSLATLEVRKNIETTIEAFNKYLLDNPKSDLNLVLSGMSGWKLEKLQEKVKEYKNIENRIIFTGFVDEDDLPILYSNALAFVYMSRYEGFGLPPLEAMACGVPVITSDNSSLPEVIGDAGFMFDCDDYVNVANTIKKLYNDKILREKYSESSINRAKLFNWDTTTEIILERLKTESQKKRDSWPQWKKSLPFKKNSKKIEGGLRTKGIFKNSKPDMPLISYVTVVWNNEKDIRRTLESVQNQTYENVEHILLDGFSTDNTLDIIREYEDKVDYFASEEDNGLYDALNKVIPLCNGDLICVLNSDDWLPENAAEIVAKNYKGNKNELILGAAEVEINDLESIIWKPSKVSDCSYFTVANCCHNAIYATKGAYKNSGEYDKTYKIAADFKWIMSCYDTGTIFTYVNEVVVNYSLGGISSDVNQHILESKRVISDKFSFLDDEEVNLINYIYYTWKEELNHDDYIGIDFEDKILNLCRKYSFSQQFKDALDCTHYKGLNSKLIYQTRYMGVKNKLKSLLKNSPRSYLFIKNVYHFMKWSRNG